MRALPGKAGNQPVPSVCVVRGRPWLRSVHRERAGRVNEPRKRADRGSRRRLHGGRQHRHAATPGVKVPPGSMSRACTQGSSRNLGGLVLSTEKLRGGQPAEQARARDGRARSRGRNEGRALWWYLRAKATKRARTGCETSELLDSTCEAGERPPGGPRGGKRGVGLRSCWRERCPGHRARAASQRNSSR